MSVRVDMTLQDDDYVVVIVQNQEESLSAKNNLSSKIEVTWEDSDNKNIYNNVQYLDDDVFMTEDNETTKDNSKTKTKNRQFRWQNSYIEELRNKHPEFREEELVEKTRELMVNCKPDLPPENFLSETGTLKCAFCKHVNKSWNAATRHYQEKHGPRYLLCYACGTNFRSVTNLLKHEKRCLSTDAHIVLKARVKVVGSKGRNRPFLDESSNNIIKRFDCTTCTATFKSKQRLTSHLYLHQGNRPFLCTECPAAYTSIDNLNRHMKTHNPDMFICDTCKTKCTTKNSLIAHMSTHLPGKFACTYPGCDKRYSQKHTLVVHVDVDHNNKPLPFRCEICDQRFRRMYRLQVHMKNHHALKIVTRNMFQKKLSTLQNLEEIKPDAAYLTSLEMLVWNPNGEKDQLVDDLPNKK